MSFKSISIAAIVAVSALSVAAAPSTAKPSNQPHFRGKVKIGLEAPLSGDQQTLGEGMLFGAQLAADHINRLGGIKHKEVIIVPIDDAGTSEVGVQAAQAAIKAGIKGVVGPYNSGVGIHTLPLYIKAGLLPIRLTSNNSTDGMGYTLQPMADEISPVAAEALITWKQAQSVAVLYDSTQNYTNDLALDLKSRLEQAGVTVVAFNAITPGADNYTAEVATVAALNPDVVYAATYFPEGGLIARAMYDQHVTASCMLDYASDDPGFISVAGLDAARAADVVGVPSPTDFPDGPAFAAEYENQFGVAPGTWSPYTYDSVFFLADGVHTAHKFGKKRLKKALDSVVNWQGITGSVTIDPATGNRVPATLVILGVDANGQFVINSDWAQAVGAPY